MAEKRKWFDRDPAPHQLPKPILGASSVSLGEAQELVKALHGLGESGKSARICERVLVGRAAMPPPARLASNLSVVIKQLRAKEIQSILQDGLTQDEREALIYLEKHRFSSRIKEIAQRMLNVDERYRLAVALGRLFREERARHWRNAKQWLPSDF